MKNHEKLSDHPFNKKNIEYVKPVFNKLTPKMVKYVQKTGKIRNKGRVFLGDLEYYHVTIFQKASAIIGAVERLENSLLYIQKFPSPRTYEKKGVHQFSWLEYHYSYFVVTYHSLFDTALILTNTVFQLGFSEKDCKPSRIISNRLVKSTSAKSALTALEKVTSKYENIRNLFVHRGEMPDVKSITNSDMLDLLKMYNTVHRHSDPIVPLDILDNVFKYESQKIITKLDGDMVKAQEAISRLFDALLPIYRNKTRR